MKTIETAHYLFHFEEGSAAQRDIDAISACQEACYQYICGVLKIQPDFKLEYFLCETAEEVGRVYGDDEPCNGFAVRPNQIYAVYNDEVQCIGFHEDAHLISYCHNRPNCTAIREGLAMYFDRKWWGIHNMDWTAYYIQMGQYVSMDKLFDRSVWFDGFDYIEYPIAGAFTEYLMNTYGVDKYLDFYKNTGDIRQAFMEVYGVTVPDMDLRFRNYVGLFSVDDCIFKRIEELLKERG